jgi:hypothetical protein
VWLSPMCWDLLWRSLLVARRTTAAFHMSEALKASDDLVERIDEVAASEPRSLDFFPRRKHHLVVTICARPDAAVGLSHKRQ